MTETKLAYTINETAALLGVSRWTVRKAIDHDELPSVRLRGCILIPAVAINRFLGVTEPPAPTPEAMVRAFAQLVGATTDEPSTLRRIQ